MAGYDSGLSGQLLPSHHKPEVDELLSSWLTRLSLAHGLDVRTLAAVLWPGKGIGNGDIDRRADRVLLMVLAQKTATPLDRVLATTLAAYEGQLFAQLRTNTTRWLLVNAMQGPRRQRPALQYCPQCLCSDSSPYFRRHWRLGFVTCCGQHRQRLLDRCPACHEPVNFQCLDRQAPSITCCYQCRFDLRWAQAPALDDTPLYQRLMVLQQGLLKALITGCYEFASERVAPLDFLRVLYQLARLLLTRKHADYRRGHLCRQLKLPEFEPCFSAPRPRIVEVLPVADRFQLMRLLAWWLDDWPERFITTCFDNLIWSRDLLTGMSAPPVWYECTAQQVSWSNALERTMKLLETDMMAVNLEENLIRHRSMVGTETSLPSH